MSWVGVGAAGVAGGSGGTHLGGPEAGDVVGGNQVIQWDLARLNELRANALERACRAVGTGLNREEWASVVPGVPYEQTCPR